MIIKCLSKKQWFKFGAFIVVVLVTFTNCTNNETYSSKNSGLTFYIDSISYCFEDTISKDQMSPFLYFHVKVKNVKHKDPIQIQIEKFKNYQPEKDSILLKYGDASIKLFTSFRTNHFEVRYKSDYEFTVSPEPDDLKTMLINQKQQNLKQQENQFLTSDILLYLEIENKSDPVILKAKKNQHFKIIPLVCFDNWF